MTSHEARLYLYTRRVYITPSADKTPAWKEGCCVWFKWMRGLSRALAPRTRSELSEFCCDTGSLLSTVLLNRARWMHMTAQLACTMQRGIEPLSLVLADLRLPLFLLRDYDEMRKSVRTREVRLTFKFTCTIAYSSYPPSHGKCLRFEHNTKFLNLLTLGVTNSTLCTCLNRIPYPPSVIVFI